MLLDIFLVQFHEATKKLKLTYGTRNSKLIQKFNFASKSFNMMMVKRQPILPVTRSTSPLMQINFTPKPVIKTYST